MTSPRPSRNIGFFLFCSQSKLLFDNARQFTARFFADLCRILGVYNLHTVTYHPPSNWQAEQFNGTHVPAIRHYVADHSRVRDKFMDAITHAYSTHPHSGTGFAPIELV